MGGAFLMAAATPVAVFGSGYEFEGVGARQVARAGASVAHVDDWTAVYWNPANARLAVDDGRAQAGAEVFGGKVRGRDSNSLSNLPGVGAAFDRQQVHSPYLLGAIGTVIPAGRRAAIAAGLYTPLLQGSQFDDRSADSTLFLDYKSHAGIVVAGLSGSYQATPKWALGLGLNALYGTISIKTRLETPGDTLTSNLDAHGVGLEAMAGVGYQATRTVRLGAVLRSGGKVAMRGSGTATSTVLPDESSGIRYDLRHPPTVGLGASWQVRPRWNTELDYNRTYWHRFTNDIRYDSPGLLQPNRGNTFHWRDSWKIRFGNEINLTPTTNLLVGFSYDKGEAVDDDSIDISTALDTYRASLAGGVAHRWNERWETVVGVIAGGGSRSDAHASYDLFGWQGMLETNVRI